MIRSKDSIKKGIEENILRLFAVDVSSASVSQVYVALGNLIKDYSAKKWSETNSAYKKFQEKQVYYFSIEFLLGKMLKSNLLNLGILEQCQEALNELGFNLDEVEGAEPEPGLGNGGLGRLAACFLDSMASLGIPGHGCGIRYKYGLFRQKIINGNQVEVPELWLKDGNVWEVRRQDKAVVVKFNGRLEIQNVLDTYVVKHLDYEPVLAVPYDMGVIGYDNNTVNNLRLFNAEVPGDDIDMGGVSQEDYQKALDYKYSVEAISQVLYPDDSTEEGKLLRLKQEYFMVSAGLQSIIRNFKKLNLPMVELSSKVAVHINDTHPALCIPELMRILVDEEGMTWNKAWEITQETMSYTNHTILSEALERWPAHMMSVLIPRVYMIIDEINRRFCETLVRIYPNDSDKVRRMAIIADGQVRMANLAIVGSHSVNGVAKLHTELLKNKELHDFYLLFPEKFNNKTNGITHRRWLMLSNPKLAHLISDTIGNIWKRVPTDMINLNEYARDNVFMDQLMDIKQQNKEKLADLILEKNKIKLDSLSIFDVQVKRLHEYKRQLLNALHILYLYQRLLDDPEFTIHPRTFIFGAKAAPGYYLAKKIIKFINALGDMINNDKRIRDLIKVVFIENYSVSLAEVIIPAAEVSEQISTASKEASGTGNMKFMMNGAVTIATMDGANIEMYNEVGDENIIIFGLRSNEVLNYYENGGYSAIDLYHRDPYIKKAVDALVDGSIPNFDMSDGMEIYHHLITHNDPYFVLKDFNEYRLAQEKINDLYQDRKRWAKMSLANIASSGQFTSDKTITQYANGIWSVRIGEHF